MSDDNNSITVSDLATALGLDAKATKADVLGVLTRLGAATGATKRRRLSKKYTSQAHYEGLAKQTVRVRVTSQHPIAERGGVYNPPVFDANGKLKTPGDVFETDRARLLKIKYAVEEVDSKTPTTAELAEAKAKAA